MQKQCSDLGRTFTVIEKMSMPPMVTITLPNVRIRRKGYMQRRMRLDINERRGQVEREHREQAWVNESAMEHLEPCCF